MRVESEEKEAVEKINPVLKKAINKIKLQALRDRKKERKTQL